MVNFFKRNKKQEDESDDELPVRKSVSSLRNGEISKDVIIKKKREQPKVDPKVKKRVIKNTSRSIARFVGLVLIVLISILIWWYLHLRNAWVFTYSEYSGLQNLDKLQLDKSISEFFGQEMSEINPDVLEEKLTENYIEISGVRAEKVFPNKVIFYIEEKNPQINYINFTGLYVLDRNGEVIRANTTDEVYEFSDEDYDLARGMSSPNAPYVEDRVYADLTEEEMKDFDFATYDPKKKEEILEQIFIERRGKLSTVLDEEFKQISRFVSTKYPVVFGWDEKKYNPGEKVGSEWVIFLHDSIEALEKNSSFKVENSLWDGDQRLILTIDIDTQVFLFPERPLNEQIEDFVFVINEVGGVEKIKTIDLSSHNVLVEYR